MIGRKLITSRQGTKAGPLHDWLGAYADTVEVVATYSLGMIAVAVRVAPRRAVRRGAARMNR